MPHLQVPVSDEGLRILKSIYLCKNCGDEIGQVKRLYCGQCSTKAGREQVRLENEALRASKEPLPATG